MFKAHYINFKTGESYWRSINEYDLNEATKLAEKYTNEGYVRVSLTEGDKKND